MSKLYLAIMVACVAFVIATSARGIESAGFNSGMLYRYPFEPGVTMTRTQGQNCSCPDHDAAHFQTFAVDWDNGVPNWKIYAANSGTLTCHAQGTGGRTFASGIVDGIHEPLTGQASIYLHLASCFPYQVETPVRVEQGFYVSNAGTTGGFPQHLHFQVISDPTGQQTAPMVSIPFSMSDRAQDANGFAFLGTAQDGPSDNVGVAVTHTEPTDALDLGMLAAYWTGGGGQADSWWNVGAAFQSDENGGVCRNTTTAFVHMCGTSFGVGLLVAQNYIDWKGVRHSVYRSSNDAGHVKGQIQGALSSYSVLGLLSAVMGAPTGPESNGLQYFEGGHLRRVLNSPTQAVRVEAWSCPPMGTCSLIGVLRYSAYGTFCPSLDGNTVVNIFDLAAISGHYGVSTYPDYLNYDMNGDGIVNIFDLGLAASKYGTSCSVVDP